MTTKFIGVKEFRRNLARVADAATKYNQRLIVLKKNRPIFELRPLSKKDVILERLAVDVHDTLRELHSGRVYSKKEISKC